MVVSLPASMYIIRPSEMLNPATPIQSTSSMSRRVQGFDDMCRMLGRDQIETVDTQKLTMAMIQYAHRHPIVPVKTPPSTRPKAYPRG